MSTTIYQLRYEVTTIPLFKLNKSINRDSYEPISQNTSDSQSYELDDTPEPPDAEGTNDCIISKLSPLESENFIDKWHSSLYDICRSLLGIVVASFSFFLLFRFSLILPRYEPLTRLRHGQSTLHTTICRWIRNFATTWTGCNKILYQILNLWLCMTAIMIYQTWCWCDASITNPRAQESWESGQPRALPDGWDNRSNLLVIKCLICY